MSNTPLTCKALHSVIESTQEQIKELRKLINESNPTSLRESLEKCLKQSIEIADRLAEIHTFLD